MASNFAYQFQAESHEQSKLDLKKKKGNIQVPPLLPLFKFFKCMDCLQ